LSYDKGLKSQLYARHGVQEFWVIDANKRVTWIHTGPQDEGWSSIVEHDASAPLTTAALPGFSIRLADLG
jgi:Uma2 family endonuclease